MPELAVLVPTRGRPGNIRKVISAWDFTNAWDHADLVLAVDLDDPEISGYQALQVETRNPDTGEPVIHLTYSDHWVPMVHKLNLTAVRASEEGRYFALGFAGDDHLPQTIGWAQRYLTVLHELGSGMVYGDDGYQGRKLSTEWAVTSDVVRALGRMVPADVEHMYCDNAMMDLYGTAGAMRHLPEVRIEHMHPYAGKAETDDQYKRVNHRDQFSKDRRAYESWRHGTVFQTDVAEIRHLRRGRPEVTDEPIPARPRVAGSAPRRLERSGPTSKRLTEVRPARPPRHFKNVRAATPEDIMITLADFATQVPADQEIVELGVFQGRTALQLAWGASLGHGAHVTAIDPWDLPGNVYSPPFTDAESRAWARHWVDTLGYADKIRLIHSFSHEVAAVWQMNEKTESWEIPAGKPVGLLFVDGDHTKDGAKRDIVSWAPHLAPSARIAVDDYGHPDWPGVGEAVDELVAEGFLGPVELFHERLAVTRLAADPERVMAITSEGVSPLPVAPVSTEPGCQHAECVLDHPHAGPAVLRSTLEVEWERVDPEGVAALRESAAELDTQVSIDRTRLTLDEAVTIVDLHGVPTTATITDLNTVQLRALAKVRGIKLGARKDKREAMLQALRDGE